uniref:Uncharacterized protein n=1 Tax=Xiphophorus couchianus TaxID=32473 RepID=A0A3B5LWZ2_9TELE
MTCWLFSSTTSTEGVILKPAEGVVSCSTSNDVGLLESPEGPDSPWTSGDSSSSLMGLSMTNSYLIKCWWLNLHRFPLARVSFLTLSSSSRDLCAAILLGCLFCRPVDCLTETFRGCTVCFCSLCSSLFGCKPGALRPLLELTRPCGPCSCRFLCDCAGCDVCLPATECLDLAMEISQMLYH